MWNPYRIWSIDFGFFDQVHRENRDRYNVIRNQNKSQVKLKFRFFLLKDICIKSEHPEVFQRYLHINITDGWAMNSISLSWNLYHLQQPRYIKKGNQYPYSSPSNYRFKRQNTTTCI